jgi:hypothetical protein
MRGGKKIAKRSEKISNKIIIIPKGSISLNEVSLSSKLKLTKVSLGEQNEENY